MSGAGHAGDESLHARHRRENTVPQADRLVHGDAESAGKAGRSLPVLSSQNDDLGHIARHARSVDSQAVGVQTARNGVQQPRIAADSRRHDHLDGTPVDGHQAPVKRGQQDASGCGRELL
ncbi:Uncharacterised protein [Mycobacteroides abscessus subsp. abscessus]|nr:Uncharacterised protein [Mycobacteroides abscessus subsp. abscessus]